MAKRIFLFIFLLCYFTNSYSRSDENETLKKKYSLNNEPEFDVRHLNKPFKINKLNLVWSKAKQVNFKLLNVSYVNYFWPSTKMCTSSLYRDVQNQN